MKITRRNTFFICLVALLNIAIAQTPPTASIINTSSFSCVSLPVTFSASPSHNAVTYTWTIIPFRGLSSFSNLNSQTVSLTFSASTAYSVSLIVKDSIGTSSSFTVLPIARVPKASFNASLVEAGYPNQLILTNYSTNQLSNRWLFNDVSTIDKSFNTSKNYNSSGSYSVTLISEGSLGCNDTARYAFRISDSSGVTLPNIFSPNADGINDMYRPITKGIYKLSAAVYNRFGTVIASWDRVNGFWDGRTTSGLPCSDGEYFIILEAFGFDGKHFKLKGTITLVR